jgi:hypothetical protein
MVRLMLVVAVVAAGVVVLKGWLDDADGGAVATPPAAAAQVPAQFRSILASQPDAMAILSQRGALPGLGVIRRFAGRATGEMPSQPAPYADVGSRREVRAVQADIRRDIRALNRLSDKDGSSIVEVEHTLSQVYSERVLGSLGEQGRRAFAGRVAGRTQAAQRIRVLDFQGVFVSGERALAQVVYRISTRAPSGRFVARAPAIWTVTLALEDGRWRFVRGIES